MLMSLIRGQLDFASALTEVLAILVIVFLVLPFHEWAHAFTALKLGDTSIKYRGRLTLNPLAHIDPFGALALLLFGIGWAKPVPIDPRNFKRPKLYMGITALMGPVANIVAAMAGCLILNGLVKFAPNFLVFNQFGNYVYDFFVFYIYVNVSLAIFNFLPIPPLDGSKILFIFLPDKWVAMFYKYEQFIVIGLLVLLWTGVLSTPLSFLTNNVVNGLYWFTGLPFKLF
ncbi:MAG: site-2 protease family protein [Ruminococcus sp.]|nr:site-2 protease family protein [Ruminococcus sp.]